MKVSLIQRQEEEEEVMPEVVAELQRQPEEEEEELQTQPDASQFPKVSDNIENRIDSARGGGQRLSDDIREPMAQAFNTDFSGVRVHTDSEANALNQQLSAKAFTSGQEIFFREGEYNPNSDTGKTLLAHELTHVVQQRGHVHAQRHTWEHSTTRGQTIQRVKRDETGNIVGLDMATCSLVGVAHEEKKSFATVKSEAWMSKPTHSVVYEIKWDAAVVPGGDHLGQVKGQASDWVVDKSIDGEAIGDRGTKKMIAPYFKNDLTWELDPAGRFFSYNDPIEQRRLQGGSWWFGLKVVDEKGSVLSQSHDVEVNWG
jgi:hypothetical protein